MSILPIAESNNSEFILVPTKHRPFCVMSKIGHNSPAYTDFRMENAVNSQRHYSAFWKLGITGDKVMEFVEFVTFYLYVITNRR